MNIPHISIHKILYATDLSDTALKAFSYAASLATLYHASITIVHVMADYADAESKIAAFIGKENLNKLKDSNLQDARQALISKRRNNVFIKDALNVFTESITMGAADQSFVTDEILVVKGNPVDQIIQISEERQCDLIVMGTHGYSVIEDMIGSTARRVLRRSKIPVLAVRLQG